MRLEFDADLKIQKGDFGAVIKDGILILPAVLEQAYPHMQGSVAVFISSIRTFPSTYIATLGWTLEELAEADKKLTLMLEGKLPEIILHPQPPTRRTYGVNPRGGSRG
ncbi:MAG: hypothetical protein ABIO72_05015 [Patescibacteria group bacterium]